MSGQTLMVAFTELELDAIGEVILDRMHAEVVKALNTPELKEIWASNGSEVTTMSPQDFAKFLNGEIKRWAQVTKASGAKLD